MPSLFPRSSSRSSRPSAVFHDAHCALPTYLPQTRYLGIHHRGPMPAAARQKPFAVAVSRYPVVPHPRMSMSVRGGFTWAESQRAESETTSTLAPDMLLAFPSSFLNPYPKVCRESTRSYARSNPCEPSLHPQPQTTTPTWRHSGSASILRLRLFCARA